jgi:glycerate kinase
MISAMDGWLSHYATLAGGDADLPGAGAAGGLGFAFSAFLNGELKSGIDIVLQEISLESHIKNADIVVTGEGRLDGQTAMGKAPIGVARLAQKHGKKVIAFAGCVTEDAAACNEKGICAFFPILRECTTPEAAMEEKTAAKNLTATAEQVFRLLG